MTKSWQYHNGPLKPNLDHLIRKVDRGFFNILLIFGATRSGKSTLAFQLGDYLARNVGVEFTEKEVFFDAGALERECSKGKKNAVFMLDEAAFDLTGEDWAKDAQKRLKTYFSVAAKYNQTFILIIPHIEELRKYFIINEHTRGIEVYYNRETLARGRCKLYSRDDLRRIYYLRKMNHYGAAGLVWGFKNTFPKTIPPGIDMVKYEAAKDAAIKSQQQEEDTSNTKKALIWRCLDAGLESSVIVKIVNTSLDYVSRCRREQKALT